MNTLGQILFVGVMVILLAAKLISKNFYILFNRLITCGVSAK